MQQFTPVRRIGLFMAMCVTLPPLVCGEGLLAKFKANNTTASFTVSLPFLLSKSASTLTNPTGELQHKLPTSQRILDLDGP